MAGRLIPTTFRHCAPHVIAEKANVKRINPYRLFIGSFLPNWLLRKAGISHGAKLCYARLAQYAGEKGVAHPGQETLAEELSVSSRQIRNYLRELVNAQLIASEQPGLAATNRYYFLWHEDMGIPSGEGVSGSVYAISPSTKGHVYVLRSGTIIKIGFTRKLRDRINNYRSHNPQIELLDAAEVDDPEGTEIRLLQRYMPNSVTEWGELDDATLQSLLNEIDALKTGTSLPSRPEKSFRSDRQDSSARSGKILPTEENQLRESTEEKKDIPPVSANAETSRREVDVLQDLRHVLWLMPEERCRDAKQFHDALFLSLQQLGWSVTREYPVQDRGDGRRGVVDLFVSAPAILAMELDAVSPRQKSIAKLKSMDAQRVIVLRTGPKDNPAPAGIDAVIGTGYQGRHAPSVRGTRLPEDWQPSPDDLAWAKAKGFDTLLDLTLETEAFSKYWRSASARATKLNWSLTWQNRMIEQAQRAMRYQARASPVPTGQAVANGCVGYPTRPGEKRDCPKCRITHFCPER